VLFLDIAPDQARLRGGYGEERDEKEAMQARVREVFKRLGDETEASSSAVDSRVRVDTTREGNSKATGAGADASANTGGEGEGEGDSVAGYRRWER
jgi:dTMP kinase